MSGYLQTYSVQFANGFKLKQTYGISIPGYSRPSGLLERKQGNENVHFKDFFYVQLRRSFELD